jgi:predicted nucleic acid-binding Zn ribbon protein
MDRVRFHLDKPPVPKRDVKSVGDILKDVISTFEEPVQESVVTLRSVWPRLVGAQISTHSEPGFIKDFALYVFVDHPGWLQELERMKRPLLMKIQTQYRDLNIRQLRFSLKH